MVAETANGKALVMPVYFDVNNMLSSKDEFGTANDFIDRRSMWDVEGKHRQFVYDMAGESRAKAQKGDGKTAEVTAEEKSVIGYLQDKLRKAGVEVVDDVEEGQRVLDEYNEGVKQQVEVNKQEYAKISAQIFSYPEKVEKNHVFTDNNYYLCSDINYKDGTFKIVATLTIEGNEDLIDRLRNERNRSNLESLRAPASLAVLVGEIKSRGGWTGRDVSFAKGESIGRGAGDVASVDVRQSSDRRRDNGEAGGLDEVKNRYESESELVEKRDQIVDLLHEQGFVNVAKSHSTAHGSSYYITVYSNDYTRQLAKIRISDHSVTSNRRIADEYHVFPWMTAEQVVKDLFRGIRGEKFFRTPEGEVYGFVKGGKMFIDPRVAKPETYVHEYSHLWAAALRQANPKAWEQLKSELGKDKELLELVRGKYPELEDEDALMDEVFAHYSGKRGAERLHQEYVKAMEGVSDPIEKAKVGSVFARLKDLLDRFWNAARDLFAGKTKGIGKMKAEDFADMTLNDLLNGFNPLAKGTEGVMFEKGESDAAKEVKNLTKDEQGTLYHKAMKMQADYLAKDGRLPLEMGVFTANHFVIVNNVEQGNISAVRAFDIEKNKTQIEDAIVSLYRRNIAEGLADGSRRLLEGAKVSLRPDDWNRLSDRLGQDVTGEISGVGGRDETERGASSALGGGTHIDNDLRFRTSEELDETNPGWREQKTASGGHSTQIKGTLSTYTKIGEHLKGEGVEGVSILDASSGFGHGTKALRDMGFDVDDVEPYPSDKREEQPTYTSYDDINKKYDVVISNAVLNVIPDDWRADVLHSMADKVKEGGKMIINVRGDKEIASQGVEGKTRETLDDASEILVKNADGSYRAYQKGYSKEGLKKYVEEQLGDGWKVEIGTEKNSGLKSGTVVVATKTGDDMRREGEGPVEPLTYEESLRRSRAAGYTKKQHDEMLERNARRFEEKVVGLIKNLHLDGIVDAPRNSGR